MDPEGQPYSPQPQPASSPAAKKPSRTGKLKKYKLPIIAILIVLLGVGGGVGYAKYAKLKKENAKLSNPQEAAKVETEQLKADVAKIIELPAENPTVATVVDATKLKNQAFFTNAQNGDKVLIFAQAKKAILYRPSTKKVVEVAPINLGDNPAGTQTTGTKTGTKTGQ